MDYLEKEVKNDFKVTEKVKETKKETKVEVKKEEVKKNKCDDCRYTKGSKACSSCVEG